MDLSSLINFLNTEIAVKKLLDLSSDVSKLDTIIPENLVKFSSDKYCRTLMYRNNKYEIYVIGWLPNQETIYHHHPEGGCIMKILEGTLIENIKNKDNTISSHKRTVGDCTYIHDNIGVHMIKNNTKDKCVSLHIYSPPHFYD